VIFEWNVGVGDEYVRRQVEEGLDESAGSSSSSSLALETALNEYTSLLTNVVTFFVQKGFRHVRYAFTHKA
jgi:hypothetical protein